MEKPGSAAPLNATQAPCPACGRLIDTGMKFCPHCGRRQHAGEAWYYHPVWVLVLALLVLGPFALILIWKSSRMGRTTKIVMAIVILIYTGYCLYLVYTTTALVTQSFYQYRYLLR
jgi:hypothetical protein